MSTVLSGSNKEASAEPTSLQASWSGWALIAAEAVVVMLIALGVRLCYQNPTAFVDEYFHLVSARTLVETGWQSLVMNEGGDPYNRAWLFTYMVAAAYELFGVSIESGRLASVVCGVLLVGVLFVWLRKQEYRAEGWATAVLISLSLEMINYSQTARFYMLQTLAVVVLAIACWMLVKPGMRLAWRALSLVIALIAAALAMHTQVTSLFAIAAVGGWTVLMVAHEMWWHSAPEHRSRNRRLVMLGMGVCAVGALAVLFSGALEEQWERYRLTYTWAEEQRDNAWFYWNAMAGRFMWMWWLLPIASLIALLRDWRMTTLALCVFVLGFVGQSFGGMKAERYLIFVLPFFLLIWGLAMGAFGSVVLRVGAMVTEAVYERFGMIRWARPLSTATAAVTVFLFLGYAMYRTPSFFTAYQLVTEQRTHFGLYSNPDWSAASPALLSQLQNDEVLMTSTSPASMFHLDRIDYGLSVSQVDEVDLGEFGRDWRTDRPVIGTVESLQKVMRQQPSGLIVVDQSRCWRKPGFVTEAVADYIEQHAQRVELPQDADIIAFRWDTAMLTAEDDNKPAIVDTINHDSGDGL